MAKDIAASPQLLFAQSLSAKKIAGDECISIPDAGKPRFAVRDKTIFEFVGSHWQALDAEKLEADACAWLATNQPDKCTDKTATSCVNTAILHLRAVPPSRKNVIPLQSGVIEIESNGEFTHRQSRHADGMTYCLACDHDPTIKPVQFMTFLEEALPSPDVRSYLQEYVGYTLLSDTRYQVAAWLLGEGGTGKGTIAAIVQALHRQTVALSLDALDGFKLAGLNSASLVCVDETPARINEQILKTLISGDVVQIDRKYRDPLTIRPTAKWLVNGNALPAISDHSTGFWRRWLIFPFNVVPAKKQPLLAQTIINEELQGVLNWALEGLQRLLKRDGFAELPAEMKQAAANGKSQSNSVAAWVQDAGIATDNSNEDENGNAVFGGKATIKNTRRDVYAAYSRWCSESGARAVAANKFWERLRTILPKINEVRKMHAGERDFVVNVILPRD